MDAVGTSQEGSISPCVLLDRSRTQCGPVFFDGARNRIRNLGRILVGLCTLRRCRQYLHEPTRIQQHFYRVGIRDWRGLMPGKHAHGTSDQLVCDPRGPKSEGGLKGCLLAFHAYTIKKARKKAGCDSEFLSGVILGRGRWCGKSIRAVSDTLVEPRSQFVHWRLDRIAPRFNRTFKHGCALSKPSTP